MADDDQNQGGEQQGPVPGSEEYNQMMAAKFREAKESGNQYPDIEDGEQGDQGEGEQSGGEEEKPQVPEGVPAKFIKEDGTVDVEALAKSYTELEKNRGQKAEENSGEGNQEQQGEQGEEAGQQAAEQAGLDYQELTQKVVDNGDLDDADYEKFEKAGVPREMVKEYIALRQDAAQRNYEAAVEYGGGEEATQELLNWASQNLSPEEIDTYNEMLGGSRWKVAMDTLKTQRQQSKKSSNEPNLRSGQSSPNGSSTGYTSRDEMREDMANPLYRDPGPKGENFRQQVARKTANASWRNK